MSNAPGSQSNRSGFETLYLLLQFQHRHRSQSNRSGFETMASATLRLQDFGLNPTVVVLKLAVYGVAKAFKYRLNPTVVVLKLAVYGVASLQVSSQSNRSGFETTRTRRRCGRRSRSQSNRSGFETAPIRQLWMLVNSSQSNRSGFETNELSITQYNEFRLNPTVVVLKRRFQVLYCAFCPCLNPTVVVLKLDIKPVQRLAAFCLNPTVVVLKHCYDC